MKNLLTARGRLELRRFLHERPALVFDFDGTLAPIVSDPKRAQMRATTRKLVRALPKRFSLSILSGRSRRDLLSRFRERDFDFLVGNHGMEFTARVTPQEKRARAWVRAHAPRLRACLRKLPGTELEDKAYSLSIHYRHCPPEQRGVVVRAIRDELKRQRGMRIVEGKDVINLIPRGAWHKGHALKEIRKRTHCARAIYVGDDVTDEDAFRATAGDPARYLTVRIGRAKDSHARFFIPSQDRIDELLRMLLEISAPVTEE